MKQPKIGQTMRVLVGTTEHIAEVIEITKFGSIRCRVQTPAGMTVRTFDEHGKGKDGARLKALRKPGVQVAR